MVERTLGKGEVTGSNPVESTKGDVAHQVEQQTENLCVVGSSPTVATNFFIQENDMKRAKR